MGSTDTATWGGDKPDNCQLCQVKIEGHFVDGMVDRGGWAIMCPFCALAYGVGLGTGKGQLYAKTALNNDVTFVKIKG
jgi:hypothetical protein